jgi:hypothetical protein
MKVKLDLGLLLTIMTTSIGLWIYILKTIISLSTEDPVSSQLFPLSFIHFLLFLLSISSIFSVYLKGLEEVNISSVLKTRVRLINASLISFMLQLWFPSFILVFFVMVDSYFLSDSGRAGFLFWSICFLGFVVLIMVWIFIGRKNFKELLRAVKIQYLLLLVFGTYAYITCMSEIFSDISIKTDKDFYVATDTIRCSIKRSGYILLPEVKNVRFEFSFTIWPHSSKFYENLSIPLSKFTNVNNLNYVTVNYESQLFSFSKEKNHFINIYW